MIVDAIARHAAERPNAVAVINHGAQVSYPTLTRVVAQFAQALRSLGLGPGQTIAVHCADRYVHLLLLLGAEKIGAISVSPGTGVLEDAAWRFGEVDLAVTDQPARFAGVRRTQTITKPWLERVLALPGDAGAQTPQSLVDPVRILGTSGTTGQPKHIMLRRGALDARRARWADIDRIAPDHRVLISGFLTIATTYFLAMTALRAGATLVFETRLPLHVAIVPLGITHVKMLPVQLRAALERLPADFPKPADLNLATVGARLDPLMRERALARLATHLSDQYGTNETGVLAERIGSGVSEISAVFPDVQLEIVDSKDHPVPAGQSGHVRVRTAFMVDAYLDDPDTSARMFRDGWFYPGDLGILHGPGRLEVIGRVDEILNIGGLKMPPVDIENRIRERAKVDDVAVCTIANADGVDELWVAAAYDAPDDRDIRARLKPAFVDLPYGHVHLVKVAQIPRTETDKIKRAELRDLVLAEASASKRAATP